MPTDVHHRPRGARSTLRRMAAAYRVYLAFPVGPGLDCFPP
jgi:hypothetical protein